MDLNVTTPTILITGEVDYHTPISETEQLSAALQIRGIEWARKSLADLEP